jgi:hypothetical protein
VHRASGQVGQRVSSGPDRRFGRHALRLPQPRRHLQTRTAPGALSCSGSVHAAGCDRRPRTVQPGGRQPGRRRPTQRADSPAGHPQPPNATTMGLTRRCVRHWRRESWGSTTGCRPPISCPRRSPQLESAAGTAVTGEVPDWRCPPCPPRASLSGNLRQRQSHRAVSHQAASLPQAANCLVRQGSCAFRQVIWPQGRHEFWPHSSSYS